MWITLQFPLFCVSFSAQTSLSFWSLLCLTVKMPKSVVRGDLELLTRAIADASNAQRGNDNGDTTQLMRRALYKLTHATDSAEAAAVSSANKWGDIQWRKQMAEVLKSRNQRQLASSSSATVDKTFCSCFFSDSDCSSSACPDVHSSSPYWTQCSGSAATLVGPVHVSQEAPIKPTSSGAATRHANKQKCQAQAKLLQAQPQTPCNCATQVSIFTRPCNCATDASLPGQGSNWPAVTDSPASYKVYCV